MDRNHIFAKIVCMKKIFLSRAIALCVSGAFAQQQKTPPPSTKVTIKQEFGLSAIDLSYSRPNVKGRKIFGELVPFGKIWRTGANAATTIAFGADVTIGGKKVPAGKYGLLTIPEQNEWTVIISKQTDVTSAEAYKEAEDLVRVKVKAMPMDYPIETFTISPSNVKASSLDLVILWDKTMLSLPITGK